MDSQIVLTENENRIFNTLLKVVEVNELNTTLRVAGGWVRDKVSFKVNLLDNG